MTKEKAGGTRSGGFVSDFKPLPVVPVGCCVGANKRIEDGVENRLTVERREIIASHRRKHGRPSSEQS